MTSDTLRIRITEDNNSIQNEDGGKFTVRAISPTNNTTLYYIIIWSFIYKKTYSGKFIQEC